MIKPTVSPIQSGQTALPRKTAKVLHHPFFNRPAVVNPKTARANSKGCINFGRVRHAKYLAEMQACVLMKEAAPKAQYKLTMEDEIEMLRNFAIGSIERLEEKFNEIKSMQAAQKGSK